MVMFGKKCNQIQAAELIMETRDTWNTKNIGDRVKVAKEYINNHLHRDNPNLMEYLLETGDLNLIEGTKSLFCGGGEPYDSEAYDNEDIHGKIHQGYMVIGLRTNKRTRHAGIIP